MHIPTYVCIYSRVFLQVLTSAQIGSSLVRGLGRPIYTHSQTNDLWGPSGSKVMMEFPGGRGGGSAPRVRLCREYLGVLDKRLRGVMSVKSRSYARLQRAARRVKCWVRLDCAAGGASLFRLPHRPKAKISNVLQRFFYVFPLVVECFPMVFPPLVFLFSYALPIRGSLYRGTRGKLRPGPPDSLHIPSWDLWWPRCCCQRWRRWRW